MVEYEYASLLIPGFVTHMARRHARFDKHGWPKWVSVVVPEEMVRSSSLQIMAYVCGAIQSQKARLDPENPGGEGTRIVSLPLVKDATNEFEIWEEAEKVASIYQNAIFQGKLDMDTDYLFGTQSTTP